MVPYSVPSYVWDSFKLEASVCLRVFFAIDNAVWYPYRFFFSKQSNPYGATIQLVR